MRWYFVYLIAIVVGSSPSIAAKRADLDARVKALSPVADVTIVGQAPAPWLNNMPFTNWPNLTPPPEGPQ